MFLQVRQKTPNFANFSYNCQTMIVRVNRTSIEFPDDTTVRTAVMTYAARRSVSKTRVRRMQVYDLDGRELDLDETLSDGDAIKCVM